MRRIVPRQKTGRRQWPPPRRRCAEAAEGAHTSGRFRPSAPVVAAGTSLLSFLRLLTQGCEIDHWAANQSRRDFERPLPRRDGSEDVVVFTELDRSHSGVPVEDLQIPGAA